MEKLRKTFRWGPSVIAILHHFSTPEVRALLRQCRLLIRRFCNPAYEGEGYQASIMAFEMFEYGFTLAYDYDDELWVLEVRAFPDWGSPQCRRRPPAGAGHQRTVETLLELLRGPDLSALIHSCTEMLYETRAIGALLTKFWSDMSARGKLQSVIEMLRKTQIPHAPYERSHHVIQFFRSLAHQSHEYRDLVQLVRAKVSDAVWFLGSVWTWPRSVTLEELWDVGLFGALPEEANG
jgi:hypothetical protein